MRLAAGTEGSSVPVATPTSRIGTGSHAPAQPADPAARNSWLYPMREPGQPLAAPPPSSPPLLPCFSSQPAMPLILRDSFCRTAQAATPAPPEGVLAGASSPADPTADLGLLALARARARRVHRAVMTGFVLLVSAMLGAAAFVLLGSAAAMATRSEAAAGLNGAQVGANLLWLRGYCGAVTAVFCLALAALLARDLTHLVRHRH